MPKKRTSNKLKDVVLLMRELYEVNRLSLREIADRLDVTKQAVHLRLKGIPQTADAGPSTWLLQYGNDHSIENIS